MTRTMHITIDPRVAPFLKALLEDEKVKKIHADLVKCYMKTADVDEDEAKRVLGPEWIGGLLQRAYEMAREALEVPVQ